MPSVPSAITPRSRPAGAGTGVSAELASASPAVVERVGVVRRPPATAVAGASAAVVAATGGRRRWHRRGRRCRRRRDRRRRCRVSLPPPVKTSRHRPPPAPPPPPRPPPPGAATSRHRGQPPPVRPPHAELPHAGTPPPPANRSANCDWATTPSAFAIALEPDQLAPARGPGSRRTAASLPVSASRYSWALRARSRGLVRRVVGLEVAGEQVELRFALGRFALLDQFPEGDLERDRVVACDGLSAGRGSSGRRVPG